MKHLVLPPLLQICYSLLAIIGLAPSVSAKDLAPYGYDRLFSPAHLVKIELEIDKDDWDTLRVQRRSLLKTLRTDVPPSKQEKQFDYFPAELSIDGVAVGRVAVRKKGFIGSMDERRPSLKIKLARFDKKKCFASVDTLTLNNNKQDPSDINQVIGYQLFRKAGLPASKCNFATVTVNGEPLGIYCNIESPDPRFAERHLGTDKGALYEGTIADFTSQGLIRFERKYGKKKHDDKLKEIAEALMETDDDQMLKKLGKVVDLNEFYRFWAMEVLIGHWDGYVSNKNNYLLYYHPDRKKIGFIPWGMDQLAEDNNPFWGRGFTPPKSVKADGALARRLYQAKEAREKYFAALRDHLATVWNEDEITSQVAQLEKLIAPHRKHSGERRRQSGQPFDKFALERRAEIESEMDAGFPEWTLGVRDMPGHAEKRGECTLTFDFMMLELEEGQSEFTDATGSAKGELTVGNERSLFSNSALAIRKNRGWGGASYTLQISSPAPSDAATIELTFPSGPFRPNSPVAVDVFASPASGRLLPRSGNVSQEETAGMMTGILKLTEFGKEPGDRVTGTLEAEFYQFIN